VPATLVVRPVVRSYPIRQIRAAAAYARQGGHVVLWETSQRARVVVPAPDESDSMDLGEWSILDLGKSRYEIVRRGALAGLATSRIPKGCLDMVRERAARDLVHPGPTRSIFLDCLQCGACCRENSVQLDSEDIERFERADRSELARMPYARRRDGKLTLRLTKERRCRLLGPDNRCGIYEIRPEMCRVFPMGSECCLSARAEEFGIYDGAAPP